MTPHRRFPTLTAALLYALVVAVAFWPFWTGHFLINPWSDMRNGYAFRLFAAEYWHQAGGFPQWNPFIFGGMPFLGAIGGDVFYPTFLLRLILPVDVGITLGFMLHVVLAGVFMYLFLRAQGLEWGAAFVGGAAYLLTGQVVSLVSPGHDGKLFVSALLPLALLLLHQAVRRADWRWYAYFGGVIGLCLLSPHFQATYYVLMAAGFLWAFLWFASDERPPSAWWRSALLFGFALLVAFAIAAVQLLPFREYLALSARGGGGTPGNVDPWIYHTGWSMPPEELVNMVWPAFSGMLESYWGRNAFKLHSEYTGVVVLMLASCAPALRHKRRWSWFFAFLALYGILFALGGYTPFYRIPYLLLPGIKLTRAPSTIFFLTSFSVAVLAAFGTQALLAGEVALKKRMLWWGGGLLGATLLAYAGVFENIMRAVADPQRLAAVAANYPAFTTDTVRVLVLALLAAGLVAQRLAGRWRGGEGWSLLLGGLVLLDLWSVERRYIQFSPPARESFAPDQVVRTLEQDSSLYRVLPANTYQGLENYFMVHHLRSALGYHANEPYRYDDLLGGKNEWRNLGSLNILKLLAVKYVVLGRAVDSPLLEAVGTGPLTTLDNQPAFLYRLRDPGSFAVLVAQALQVSDSQTIAVLLNPQFDPRRLLIVPPDARVGVPALQALPPLVPTPVTMRQSRPGMYRAEFGAPLEQPAYLFVSENYDPAWRALADGKEARVVRAQYALMAVAVPAGTRAVELAFSSPGYRRGKALTLGALLVVLLVALDDRLRRRLRAGRLAGNPTVA